MSTTASMMAHLERRQHRRQREHARAWKRYTTFVRQRAAPDVVLQFKHAADVSIARFDECRLILNALKRLG